MKNGNSGNKKELPTGANIQSTHREQVMDDIFNTKKKDCDECKMDDNNDKLAKRLHQPVEGNQEYAVYYIVSHTNQGKNGKFVVC